MALTPEQEARLAQLQAKSITPEQEARLAELQAKAAGAGGDAPEEESTATHYKKMAIHGLENTGKGLDYAGGTVRAGLAKLAGGVLGKELVRPGEISEGLKFNKSMPTTSEYLERAGVPEGKHLSDLLPGLYENPGQYEEDTRYPNKGGAFDPSVRGAVGFLGDLVTDPLNYFSLGGAAAAKNAEKFTAKAIPMTASEKLLAKLGEGKQAIRDATLGNVGKGYQAVKDVPYLGAAVQGAENVARFPSKAANAIGDKFYEKGLGPIMDMASRKGKREAADTYYRYGFSSMKGAEDKLRGINGLLGDATEAITKNADRAGATVSRQSAWQPMYDKLSTLIQERRITQDEADKILKDLSERYHVGPDPSTSLAAQWKSDIRNKLPSSHYDELAARAPDAAAQVRDSLGYGLRRDVESEVEKGLTRANTTAMGAQKAAEYGKGEASKLSQMNSDWSNLLATKKTAYGYAQRVGNKKVLDPIDWLLLSGELPMSGNVTAGTLIAKKTLDAFTNPNVQMKLGYALKKLGKGGLSGPAFDALLRKKLADTARQPIPSGEEEQQ